LQPIGKQYADAMATLDDTLVNVVRKVMNGQTRRQTDYVNRMIDPLNIIN
jgi:hypothetical protein